VVSGAAPALFSVGLASIVEVLITVEWSFPCCESPSCDGPLSAVFGFPFPYVRWSLASSLQYLVLPHVYLANVGMLSLLTYFLVRRLVPAEPGSPRRLRMGLLGLTLCTVVVAWRIFLLEGSSWLPVRSIELAESYREFRPVGLSLDAHYQCTPSEFWYGTR